MVCHVLRYAPFLRSSRSSTTAALWESWSTLSSPSMWPTGTLPTPMSGGIFRNEEGSSPFDFGKILS